MPPPLNALGQLVARVQKRDRLVTILAQLSQMQVALRPYDYNFIRHPVTAIRRERHTPHNSSTPEHKLHTQM